MRQAAAYSSESHGSIERYHSTLRQQVQTLREAVAENYEGSASNAYGDLMTWLVKHATWIYDRSLMHVDGQFSYERRWMGQDLQPLHLRFCRGNSLPLHAARHPEVREQLELGELASNVH